MRQTIKTTQDLAHMQGQLETASETPIYYSKNRKLTTDYKGIMNDTTGEIAQIASRHYQIIQHQDVVQALSDALTKKNISVFGKVDTFNNQIRADLIFGNKSVPVKDGNKGIQLGIRVVNSYNKATSFRLEMFGYRLVCENGMVLGSALNNVKEITYHMGKEKTLEIIQNTTEQFITTVINSSQALQAYVDECLADSTEWKNITKLLEKYLNHKKHRNQICELLGISVIEVYDRKTKKRSFSYVLEDGANKIVSRWDLYNALTNYASHTELGQSVENNVQKVAQTILTKSYERLLEVTH